MMNKLLIPALAATAFLAGCDNQDHNIVAGDPSANEPAPAKIDPSMLPPSVKASKTYRCKDNSLVYIDWMSDDSARVKTDKADPAGTSIKLGEPGAALTGDATAATITFNGKSCKA